MQNKGGFPVLRRFLALMLSIFLFAGISPVLYPANGLAMATQKEGMETLPIIPEASEAEKAHYLAFSALYEVLNHFRVQGYDQLYCQLCRDHDEALRDSISQYWGIVDRDSALERLNRFFQPGRLQRYEDEYQAYQRDKSSVSKEVIKKINIAETALVKHLRCNAEDLKRVNTIAGWDLMRCANLTKTCYNLEYITEEEAWLFLQANAERAEAIFETWQDYFISFMMGRVLSYSTEQMDAYVISARLLFWDPACEWFNPLIRPER